MIVNNFKSLNTRQEITDLLADAERSSNSRIDSDDIMTILYGLETKALAFKKQGGDACVLRRVSERLEALSSQLVTR